MRSSSPLSQVLTLGGRAPAVVGGLIVAIVAASLLGAVAPGLVSAAALLPAMVWRGEAWRLVTWVLFEGGGPATPLNLILGGLTLFWFGRDLCYAWGPRRFLAAFFGVAAAAAAATCVLGRLVLPGLMIGGWSGPWVAITALIVAWSLIFPDRQILFMMTLPVSGQAMLWVTIGGTVLYAIFSGFQAYVPHLLAQLLMLGYARGWSLRGLWQSWRIKQYERRARRRSGHLKVVKKEDRWLN